MLHPRLLFGVILGLGVCSMVSRSSLGMLSGLQSRTQSHVCYKFSRSASASTGPTIGDVKVLNKTIRQLKANPVTLRFWKLEGPLRLIGYPDASYRNNEDKSSQRAQVIFLAEPKERGGDQGDSYGSLIDYESQKIKRTVLSTTVSELYYFMTCSERVSSSKDSGWISLVARQRFTCVPVPPTPGHHGIYASRSERK